MSLFTTGFTTRPTREGAMHDGLDVPLEDSDIREEVELVSSLMVAAGTSEDSLTPEQIDELLGVPEAAEVPEQQSATRRQG